MSAYVQKVTARGPGPVHLDPTHIGLTLCGRRLKGFGVRRFHDGPTLGAAWEEAGLCAACVRHDREGTRRAWRA